MARQVSGSPLADVKTVATPSIATPAIAQASSATTIAALTPTPARRRSVLGSRLGGGTTVVAALRSLGVRSTVADCGQPVRPGPSTPTPATATCNSAASLTTPPCSLRSRPSAGERARSGWPSARSSPGPEHQTGIAATEAERVARRHRQPALLRSPQVVGLQRRIGLFAVQAVRQHALLQRQQRQRGLD